MSDILERAAALREGGVDFVMVTVVETWGSVPAELGTRMIVFADGTSEGTVGGGALEKSAVDGAVALLAAGGSGGLERVEVADLEMKCGGGVTLFVEPFRSSLELWIFGGGHIASALVPIAASLGFRVTVVDNREEFAARSRFPAASATVASEYVAAAREIPRDAFAAIMTHGHAHDQEVLRELLSGEPSLPYVGMIGSVKKVPVVLDALRAEGLEVGDNVYSPIGLDLGGGSPGEIAVSIASELLAVLHERARVTHMRERLRKAVREGG
jgi:xanthine dehydrogenase accessory factor